MELTREVYEQKIKELGQSYKLRPGEFYIVQNALLRHDAARQAKLEEMEQERIRLVQANDAWHARVASMKEELATAQNALCTAQDQIPPDMEGDSLSVALIKLTDARRTAQARVKALEEELYQWKSGSRL
jgi:hypothetical protein